MSWKNPIVATSVLAAAAVGVAAQLAQDLPLHSIRIDVADVQMLEGVAHRVSEYLRGRVVENDHLPVSIGGDHAVHGAGDQVAQQRVGALQLLFDVGARRQVQLHADHGLDGPARHQGIGVEAAGVLGPRDLPAAVAPGGLTGLPNRLDGAFGAGIGPVEKHLVAQPPDRRFVAGCGGMTARRQHPVIRRNDDHPMGKCGDGLQEIIPVVVTLHAASSWFRRAGGAGACNAGNEAERTRRRYARNDNGGPAETSGRPVRTVVYCHKTVEKSSGRPSSRGPERAALGRFEGA